MIIALIMAMQNEAEPIITKLQLEHNKPLEHKLASKLPIKAYTKILGSSKIFLILNGMCNKHNIDRVGTQAAAVSCFVTAELIKPDLIISLGTAGGNSTKLNIGDVIIGIEHFLYHDRRIPLPQFEEFGLGLYPVYKKSIEIAKACNLKTSIIATGNSLINSKEDIEILNKHNVYAKEMEVASIAEIANNYKIPVLAVKSITDFFDTPDLSPEQFLNNFNLAMNNLAKEITSIIEYLTDEQTTQL